ncbi:uncharacterized protein N7477_000554 [Penicillium maclennaniae]|uniref:uncharacterized protein n=1 Tax=Penicillium maclennaniae TaxID=1343394 RepID=UPI00253FFB2B|nr:uncharacterized protein N7477_000554 [Penicillium maclennaniae]KAJ5684209.1 hypothetical protein N7477_000554 [Penicillium maclennaniae]
MSPSPRIHSPLRLEITKEYDQSAIQFLVNGMRALPTTFAQSCKNSFIHPALYTSGLPAPIREIHHLCLLNLQAGPDHRKNAIIPLLRQKFVELHRQYSRPLSFEELLSYSQALLLIQCILALNEDDQAQYSESVGNMIAGIGSRLWEQAPLKLPSTLSRRHAWLLAESVRRTIIVSLMLRSAYSMKTRKCSSRTPFADALPFDVRTNLWDDESNQTWADHGVDSPDSMISLHEYSDAMGNGQVHDVHPFGALILAACKGMAVSAIPFPPRSNYIMTINS